MSTLPALRPRRLRALTLSRGAHVSAASGLVCANGRAWVIADDALHLACFSNASGPGTQQRLLPGRLPADKGARKKLKPDFECLLPWRGGLIALGSGSRPNRGIGVAAGAQDVRPFSLEPLYAALRARLGRINIEGALIARGELMLLHRAERDGAPNTVARWPEAVFERVLAGTQDVVAPTSLHGMKLGAIDGVALGFTDACVADDGGWLFSAAAEATRDSYFDGACAGSAVGHVDAGGRVTQMRRVAGRAKVEGIAARRRHDGALELALVTDADDAREPAWLLRATWR